MSTPGPRTRPALCVDCGETDESKFYTWTNKKTGEVVRTRNRCRKCRSKKINKTLLENGKIKQYRRTYEIKKSFGITQEQYNRMLYDQNLECAACSKSWELDKSVDVRAWPVDHCHQTGKIRGIICPPCNKALGFVEDSIETLEGLIKYLKERG